MSLSPFTRTTAAAALALLTVAGFSGRAAAQPGAPTGLKGYGLMMWQREHARTAAVPSSPTVVARSYGSVPMGTVSYAAAPAATATATAPAAGTVTVRGPDGVTRTYAAEGGAVQQQLGGAGQTVQTYTYLRGPDGVVRPYLVTSPATGQVVTPGATVVTSPCR